MTKIQTTETLTDKGPNANHQIDSASDEVDASRDYSDPFNLECLSKYDSLYDESDLIVDLERCRQQPNFFTFTHPCLIFKSKQIII